MSGHDIFYNHMQQFFSLGFVGLGVSARIQVWNLSETWGL